MNYGQCNIKYIMCLMLRDKAQCINDCTCTGFQVHITEVYRFQLKSPLDEDEDHTHQ